MSNLLVRILFALGAMPTFLAFLWFPTARVWGMVGLVAVGLWEFGRMIHAKHSNRGLAYLMPGLGILAMSSRLLLDEAQAGFVWSLCLITLLFYHFQKSKIETLFASFSMSAFGLWFLGEYFFEAWVRLGQVTQTQKWHPWVFLICCMWGSDSFAYFAGKFLGKKKLCPTISPKKTWAGALGGALGTAIFAALTSTYFLAIQPAHGFILGLALSISAQMGDLLFSSAKRYTGIKDSSHIFPGHGGVLDRFDSLFLSAPVLTWLLFFIESL